MGQSVSVPSEAPRRARLRPLPPSYAPLCEAAKAGEAAAPSSDDIKDALSKILEFGPALAVLPKASEVSAALPTRSPEQQMQEIANAADSVDELFQYITSLTSLSTTPPRAGAADASRRDGLDGMAPGLFDVRVASYVKKLQALYQVVKKEKHRHEQRLLAAQTNAASARSAAPPPLPLPTQNCLTMGWDLVVLLLKATRKDNPDQYLRAIQMIKDSLRALKPTSYADSMYLAPSASAAFNLLSDSLGELASPNTLAFSAGTLDEAAIGASTIEALAEVALTRGSLPTLLYVVRWLMEQPTGSTVNMDVSLSKLASLKEQPFYGRCEASGELYCCGQNSYGELGIGDDLERHQLTSVGLCGWDDIRQVVSGNEILGILTNDGVVLTCGLNKSGQCGQGHFDERVMLLRPVQALRSQKIKFIAASNGCEHMIALTDTGLAYSWGYNDRGQLGHENLTTKIHLPKLIESMKDKKLGFAAVSYHHSAMVTDNGELYTFGMNDCGQLGLDHTQHQSTPQLVRALEGHEVTMVSCGLYHTVICTASGELFSCGKNDYGQLGLGHSRQMKLPSPVGLSNEIACFVACGYYHTIAITSSGRTFSFGRNDYGQLGIGSKIHQNLPNMITLSASTRMLRATCGCYHTVLLSEQGCVFVFGRNNKGQLGNRSSADSLLPVPLKVRPEKNSRRCIDVAAGFYTTSLIVERKRENDDGESHVSDHISLAAICGRVDIDRSGEIEGLSNFGSISTTGVSLFHGKWFYEVEVVTSGLIQIGWIDGYFQGSSDQGEGVGDHAHSWSYDGNRQRRWNSGSSSYGEKWKAGDIIGCLLDLASSEMSFFRNGINLGVAYSGFKCSESDMRSGLMPGISLERGEIIRVNLGHQPFAYPPTVVQDFDSIARAVKAPASSALITVDNPDALEGTNADSPSCLRGAATVVVQQKMFVIGGVIVDGTEGSSEVEPCTNVWVYHIQQKQWERWSDFPIPIQNHQAVAVDDNNILVIGGENKTATSRHMDLYKCSTIKGVDGSLPAWTLVQGALGAATSMPAPRAFHTAAAIRVRLDAVVFMFGGKSAENELLGDAWYLSLDDYSWSRLPNSISLDPGPRVGCTVTVIGESVYLFGGQDKDDKLRADLWRYNTFDRVWHLCHDDNISAQKDSTTESTDSSTTRAEFNPAMPDPRTDYSFCSDLGNVWVLGGVNKAGQLLNDLWCYSIASQKWAVVDSRWSDGVDGCASATLFIENGAVTGLTSSSQCSHAVRDNGAMHVYGGRVVINGSATVSKEFRAIASVDTIRSYTIDTAKTVTTTGKSAHILSILRSKCGVDNRHQICSHQALDTAVCLLAHLDRLAGSDVLGEDTESIQLSRCLHRQLCIDPTTRTFNSLFELLRLLVSRFLESQAAEGESAQFFIEVLFPLLVTLRLLKLNMFELIRSGADPTIDSTDETVNTISAVRGLLFDIVEHDSMPDLSTEAQWFYHAVKQESAATVYHGFSILFPSLLDRLQVMNKLLDGSPQDHESSSPAKRLLTPMLVPCFASAKMLFQLMSNAEVLFATKEVSDTAISTVVSFVETLIGSLWRKSSEIIERGLGENVATVLEPHDLESLEQSDEFKCLNVLLRATLFWCSSSTESGWRILESASTKLIECLLSLLKNYLTLPSQKGPTMLLCVQHSFPGKLLPFLLLSAFSLPSVRDSLLTLADNFWPHIETLITSVHCTLAELENRGVQSTPTRCAQVPTSTEKTATLVETSCNSSHATLTSELRMKLGLPDTGTLSTATIYKYLWRIITQSPSYSVWKVMDLAGGYELRRVTIPADLGKLFGTDVLLVKYQRESPEIDEIGDNMVSFKPSLTILSQHIFPVSNNVTVEIFESRSVSQRGNTCMTVETNLKSDAGVGESKLWLQDLQKILVWVGSGYAAALVVADEHVDSSEIDLRWQTSPLFKGGLEDASAGCIDQHIDRNNALLQQIVDNTGAGKRLLDKLRNALEVGPKPLNGNPQLRATRLKRQDSVEATLEKSGGFEAVDRAVRVTFAVLLKHSNVSYVSDPFSIDGSIADTAIDTWRSALTLRRWIVREQQKLAASASEGINDDTLTSEATTKERQQSLYNIVCEPIIRRGLLLLRLAPASIASAPLVLPPLKLLPGISVPNTYGAVCDMMKTANESSERNNLEATDQMHKILESKTTETIDEEDERLQADVFAFIQQSAPKPRLESSQSEVVKVPTLEVFMNSALTAHRKRALRRLQGLKTFRKLLESTESLPRPVSHILPTLSSTFKRIQTAPDGTDGAMHASRVHYLTDLDLAGSRLCQAISEELFGLLELLLQRSFKILKQMNEAIDARSTQEAASAPESTTIDQAAQDILLVMETFSLPYRNDDWRRLQETSMAPLLMELGGWKCWTRALHYELLEAATPDAANGNRYPILPAGVGCKYSNIICSRKITMGTDLQQLSLAHKPTVAESIHGMSLTLDSGGLSVYNRGFTRGRWYWEITLKGSPTYPVFVGVTSGGVDLNGLSFDMSNDTTGIYMSIDNCNHSVETLCWPESRTVGVLLNCEERRLEFYSGDKRICIANLGMKDVFPSGYFPTIGLRSSEVMWDLMAPVPPKIWCTSIDFQLPTTLISGSLVALPFDGSVISWDGKRGGTGAIQHISGGNVVSAGDLCVADDQHEIVVSSQSFSGESLFIEVRIIAAGRDGRTSLAFGIVGCDINVSTETAILDESIAVKCNNLEETEEWSLFGVLFDFDKGTITIFADHSDPVTATIDLSKLQAPYFPAVSALCNGTVFDVNFHPQYRPELPSIAFRPAGERSNSHVSSSNDVQLGKALQLEVVSCDGGEFSASHGARNCLADDPSVYSSTKAANVNLVLRHEVDTPMCISYITVRGPGPEYSSPMRHAVVFVTSSPPDVKSFDVYNDIRPEEFAALPFTPNNGRCPRDEMLPVAYFVLDGGCSQISKQLAYPVTGRFILVKFLCPSAGSNIDVGFFGACGIVDRENGPGYMEPTLLLGHSCDECKLHSYAPGTIFYSPRSGDSIKLCASCYDDNCGDIDEPHYAFTMADQDDTQTEGKVPTLCLPRRTWSEKAIALVDMAKRAKHLKLGVGGTNLNTSSPATSVPDLAGASTDTGGVSLGYEDCELFSCGQNNYGELCLGHCNSSSKLEHVPFFSAKSVRDIAGGNEVLAVVLKDGSVYTCGLNKSGQCGNGTFEERVIIATPVRALSGIPINMVAASNGCEHMLAVAADGGVYSWGYNDRGQLGLGSTISKSHTPRLIESLREKYFVTYAAVSYHHSAVVSSVGELLTFGMNDCGQLGLDHTQHQHTPQLVDSMSSQVATKVACGLYHTVVTTAGGDVYSFGKNDYGQLGLGHVRNVKVPNLVKISIGDSDEKVVAVSCGYYHTVVISEKGKLITWGRNDYGQLGIGSKDHKNSPQYVPLPLSSKIKSTSCGCYHTLLLLSNGRVMVFGRNNKGQLGASSRTLPSADLPLPIPSNSLANDDVVRVAAGFYSSYILTGRSTDSGEQNTTEDGLQSKDLVECNGLGDSEALFESLMKEIDCKNRPSIPIKTTSLKIRRESIRCKLPLVKLHAGAWAMIRALMYQSLKVSESSKVRISSNGRGSVNAFLGGFITYLLELLKSTLIDYEGNTNKGSTSCHMNLKDTCVGMLKHFASRSNTNMYQRASDSLDENINNTYSHLLRNQVMWVLLNCGSTNSEVGAIIGSSPDVTSTIISGINASDLASATISLRMAMFVFPLHSVSAINKLHRSITPGTPCSGDVVAALLILIGLPLILRPRLCSHELGIEASSTTLCESAKCIKGVSFAKDIGIGLVLQSTMERSHIAEAKSAEAVGLLRYLTLFPSWKIAVNAALRRCFTQAQELSDILDAIYSYYSSSSHSATGFDAPEIALESNPSSVSTMSRDQDLSESSLRKPETTSSPEIDEATPDPAVEKDRQDLINMRDKNALKLWQAAKNSLDSLAMVMAAVTIVGGHVESFREGAAVCSSTDDAVDDNLIGTLVSLKKDNRGDIVATAVNCHSHSNIEANADQLCGTPVLCSTSVKQLNVLERIPAIVDMFDGLDDIVMALSSMILPINSEQAAVHCDLEQPQNTYVHEILRSRLNGYKRQIQWRSTKALSTLLKQMPALPLSLINADSQLVSSVAQLLASENSIALLNSVDNSSLTYSLSALQNRWLALKKRQIFLETEQAIDKCLDQYEASIRDAVVRRLGDENALTWGIDAIQSPRRSAHPSSLSPSILADGTRNSRKRSAGAGSELPFGTWGVLHPLPPLNENENEASGSTVAATAAGVSYTPFLLSTPIVRVGRAADSCDLIINDRSVSGRHFHLRRLRREGDNGEEMFELQDFSKNGTIVNGIRIHGTSVRITPGSRVSLILSRGGLITYEFQVRGGSSSVGVSGAGVGVSALTPVNTVGSGVGSGRFAPPPIITGLHGDTQMHISGQEYQQPSTTPQNLAIPRSPAEIQNRGSATRTVPTPAGTQNARSRITAAQGLTLITSIAESEVPRALISPNPAVDSPRVGGYNSPRSSVLQLPGTPVAGTPPASMCRNMVPPGLLSPASFQQRNEALGDAVVPGVAIACHEVVSASGDALRIALGRESVLNRGDTGQPLRLAEELSKTRVMRASGDTSAVHPATSSAGGSRGNIEGHALAQLTARARDDNINATSTDCEEALRVADGNSELAYSLLRQLATRDTAYSVAARHLACMLGKSEAVCTEALHQTENSVGGAIRLLLSSRGDELENVVAGRFELSTKKRPLRMDGCNGLLAESGCSFSDPLLHYQEIAEENASYELLESSAVCNIQRSSSRPCASPHKLKSTNDAAEATASDLSLWAESNMVLDTKIQQMTLFEIEQEETSLWQQLTAAYTRQLLSHIVRLYSSATVEAENPICELSEQLTLRRLIAFVDTGNLATSTSSTNSNNFSYDSHRQNILARLSTEAFTESTARTVNENWSRVRNLARLVQSIDQSDSETSQSCTESLISALVKGIVTFAPEANVQDTAFDPSAGRKLVEDITFDTILHIASRTLVTVPPSVSWDASIQRGGLSRESSAPKGPIALSCGLEAMVVSSYERMWSIPAPDPLMKYRHRWRKRQSSSGSGSSKNALEGNTWIAKSAANQSVTIWRPVLPPGSKVTSTRQWFSLGDVVKYGNESPDEAVLLVCDDSNGFLLPPVGYERVDVTGKGLPTNAGVDNLDLRRKQQRSVWWPIAPPGYVALGCVAGNKDDPLEPPKLSVCRCLREDLVRRVNNFRCVWRSCNTTPGGTSPHLGDADEISNGLKNQSDPALVATHSQTASTTIEVEDIVVETSLWSIDADFCGALMPVITLNDPENSEPSVAFSLNLSDDDRVLCAPVTIRTVMAFVEATLHTHKLLLSSDPTLQSHLRPELATALFALIRHVLSERLPDNVSYAVKLIRALIFIIQDGGSWRDKDGLLYCRSKIMALHQDQESSSGVMFSSLFQAFVELLLVVEEQDRADRVQELNSCMHKDVTISLPYRLHFAKEPFVEMMVSHSSKMNVTRHFSGEERKFLLDYHAEDGVPNSAVAAGEITPSTSEFYSCRFEHTPELIITMSDIIKAELVYFEVTIVEWGDCTSGDANGGAPAPVGTIGIGFSPSEFPLEGALVGQSLLESSSFGSTRSFSLTPTNGKVQCCADSSVDRWRWNEQQLTPIVGGDVIGCGLRMDTREMFFTRNGQLLGTAFSSISRPHGLHPTISVNSDCKLLINFGASLSAANSLSIGGREMVSMPRTNFSYRFHSFDCENIMSSFEWFEQLSQVFGVMKALMVANTSTSNPETIDNSLALHPADVKRSGQLPDEFLLSADNFLSEISEDVCIRVESTHPYDLDLKEALVSIPLATSIRVKLDPRCETANSHCLQILQGGDAIDTNGGIGSPTAAGSGSGESEVRAFTGACGGQEVTLDGDSFVWRFPVQSNFQCRVDRVRKGPYLKLENRDTRLSLVRDKGWQTAIGVARFDSGVHVWEVRISFVTASSNIFLGVARKDVRLDSYLGKDNRGWGWIGNRALWHNGSKQRGTYGEKFKTGDVVRLTLDLRRGTLSYALNGKDLGVAFGPGGTGPKLEGTFYPGFALYNQRDSIDLIGGHRVEDGGGNGGLDGEDEDALTRSGSAGGLLGVSGDDMYYSEDDEDEAGGEGNAGDTSIPNFRMELAIVLSQMGFPMEWCVYALKHCDDDAEQAADFILAHMHNMEALVREEAETIARRARQRQLLHEHAAIAAIAAVVSTASDTVPPPPPTSIETASEIRGEEYATEASLTDDGLADSNSTVNCVDADASSQSVPAPIDKWGIAFTAVPEFSITGRRLLATKYRSKLERLHASQAIFTLDHDCAIVAIVNEVCEARAEALLSCDPLRMTPEEFLPTEEHLRRFPCLTGIPLADVQKRFLILRNFNCRLQNSLAYIDFSIPTNTTDRGGHGTCRPLLSQGVRNLRGIIFQHVKLAWWLTVLKDQQAPAAARPEIEIDRGRARDATEANGMRDSVFAQAMDQLHVLQPSLLRGADRAFKCQFVGEFGDDFGGLYRECLAHMSAELQSRDAMLPVMRPCPNSINGVGDNRELFIPNVHLLSTSRHVSMAEFLGKLMGIAVRTKTPLDLNLPSVFWKLLVVDTIRNVDKHGITPAMFDEIVDATFSVLSSCRKQVELLPGGSRVQVTWDDKDSYAKAIETYRLREFAPVCAAVLRGIATILPAPTLALFTWRELRTLVCGKPTVDIDLLRRRTIYGDGCQATDPHIAYFWDVLSEFTDEQKSSFLRFVWGRSRLPTHAADFTQDFKIAGLPKAAGRADMYLPIAHTCFFSIDLPPYTSRDVMRDKLLYAITHCQSIDADNTTVAQRAGQGLNWTNTAATATAAATAAISSVMAGMAGALASGIEG